MIAQNGIDKIRLGNSRSICGTPNEFFVRIVDDQLLVLDRKSPRADMTVQCAAATRAALDVVALLAERLPVTEIVGAVPRSRNFVVWAELYIRLLCTARSAFVPIHRFQVFPVRLIELGSRFALLTNVQALQLVTIAFFDNRCEAFLPLQFPQTAEDVLVGLLSSCVAEVVYSFPNLILGKNGTWNAMRGRPECLQNNRVVKLVYGSWRHKSSLRVRQPLLPARFRLVRNCSRGEEISLARSRFAHLMPRSQICA